MHNREIQTSCDQGNDATTLDKFRGCLIGGAAGDALGYAVEFLTEEAIFSRFGEGGIREYVLRDGKARVSDDTQMTMFTANGILLGAARNPANGSEEAYLDGIAAAYREWYETQRRSDQSSSKRYACWLMNVPELFATRAPGNTCLSAIRAGCCGSIENPVNASKGCGGVMRVAPVGLYFGNSYFPSTDADRMGANAAALTHGHEMGYIPGAMLAHIISLVSQSNRISLKNAVLEGIEAMKQLFPKATNLPDFLRLIHRAVTLSESSCSDLDAIHELGEGWVGDEALAISIYCALKYSEDFDKALIAAVNHNGDSDSTGAITGNIMGAYLGLSAIPQKYLDNLEMVDILTELADDLYYGCLPDGNEQGTDSVAAGWKKKYKYHGGKL